MFVKNSVFLLSSLLITISLGCSKKEEIAESKVNEKGLDTKLVSLQDDLVQTKKKLESYMKDLAFLKDARKKFEDLEVKVSNLEKNDTVQNTEIESLKKQLAEQKNELENLNKQLLQNVTDNNTKIADLETKLLTASATDKAELIKQIQEIKELNASLEQKIAQSNNLLKTYENRLVIVEKGKETIEAHIAELEKKIILIQQNVSSLEFRITKKLSVNSLAERNRYNIQHYTGNLHKLAKLHGKYNILVVPVEFSDKTFDGHNIQENVDQKLFGNEENTLKGYYKHISGGLLAVDGDVEAPVKLENTLSYYAAHEGSTKDTKAQNIVKEALKQVAQRHQNNPTWADKYDNWDLNDYDGDYKYDEKDGYADAVIFVVAGKEESACSGLYKDTDQSNIANDCRNRIWPHRSSLYMSPGDIDQALTPPVVEGKFGPVKALQISPNVQAFDYNMNTEYSDVSTISHETGHSFTLFDLYAYDGENAVGKWDIMSVNADGNSAQEMSAFHKMMLGWLNPKVITYEEAKKEQGAGFYLGYQNYASKTAENQGVSYSILPRFIEKLVNGTQLLTDIVSTNNGGNVYRAALLTLPTVEKQIQLMKMPNHTENGAIYAGAEDEKSKKYRVTLDVPTGGAVLTFDQYYAIESGTNFFKENVKAEDIKIIEHFDHGYLKINGELIKDYELRSGDKNKNDIVEEAPGCKEGRLLALRDKYLAKTINYIEAGEFETLYKKCSVPVWTKESLNLQKYAGQTVELEFDYTTDGGTLWEGWIIDNLTIGEQKLQNFEAENAYGDWLFLNKGFYSKKSNRFYIAEYRDPLKKFAGGTTNRDNKIITTRQGYFVSQKEGENKSFTERFRLIEAYSQPGVLLWYFNSDYGRRENEPMKQNGEGFMLTLNSKVKEILLPSELAKPEYLNAAGFYDGKSKALVAAKTKQSIEFACYAFPTMIKSILGKDFDCDTLLGGEKGGMAKLKFNDMHLSFTFDAINNYLPSESNNLVQVNMPFSGLNSSSTRGGYSTFRSSGMGDYKPYKIYKVDAHNNLVLDQELTEISPVIAKISTYNDAGYTANAPWRTMENKRFAVDSAVVVPANVSMEVADPDQNVLDYYNEKNNPDTNNYIERSPQAKVYFKVLSN